MSSETKSIWFINLPYDKIINYCHAFKLLLPCCSPFLYPLPPASCVFAVNLLFPFLLSLCLVYSLNSLHFFHIFSLVLCVYLNLANEFKTISTHMDTGTQ